MDLKREKVLIEGGLTSTCLKAGRIVIQREFVTCEKFREIFASCVKLPDIESINCTSMMYIETGNGSDRRYTFLINIFTGSVYYYRCSFSVTIPGGKHTGSGCIVTRVSVVKWEWDWSVDFNPDEME